MESTTGLSRGVYHSDPWHPLEVFHVACQHGVAVSQSRRTDDKVVGAERDIARKGSDKLRMNTCYIDVER